MIRVLVLIAVAGFVVCLISLGGAAALGGADVAKNGWHWPSYFRGDWEYSDDSPLDWDSPVATREIAWEGDDDFTISAPADITYTQGPAAKLTVEGPRDVIDRLELDGGHLHFRNGGNFRARGHRLRVTLTAPDVTKFTLLGSEKLSIDQYKQDELELHIAGSGDIVAKGEARRIELHVAGSGDADLGAMENDETSVSIAGSGDAKIAPKQRAEIRIAGSGDITLLTHPNDIEQHIAGSGKIYYGHRNVSEQAPPEPPAVPTPPAAPGFAAPPAPPAPPAKAAPAAKAKAV